MLNPIPNEIQALILVFLLGMSKHAEPKPLLLILYFYIFQYG